MMADGSLLRSEGETWGPVSPDNVHETGVSPDGWSRSPVVAAEAQQVSELEERPGHRPDPRFLCPTGSAPIERTISKLLVLHPGHLARRDEGSRRAPHSRGYRASEKGGYLSVTRTNAYAVTRTPHRMTPCTKSNRPFGYRPVNKMANQAMITTTIAAIHRKNSTM